MTEILEVTWEDYDNMIHNIIEMLDDSTKNYSLVCIYRGSLLMGQHLSNVLELPLSIVKFQSYDGKDNYPEWVINNLEDEDDVIILDDIYDSGKTLEKVKDLIGDKMSSVQGVVLHHNNHNSKLPEWVHAEQKTKGMWVAYPWEI